MTVGFSHMQGFVYKPNVPFPYQFFLMEIRGKYIRKHMHCFLQLSSQNDLLSLSASFQGFSSAFPSPTLCLPRDRVCLHLQMQRMFRRLWVAANRTGSPFNPISGSAQWACPAHCGQKPLFICFYQPKNRLSEKWNFAPSDCLNSHQKTNEEIV